MSEASVMLDRALLELARGGLGADCWIEIGEHARLGKLTRREDANDDPRPVQGREAALLVEG